MKHGNIEIPTEAVEAIRTIPKKAVEALFENIRRDYQGQITATTDNDLTKLKAKVESVNTLEQLFLAILREKPPTSFS